MSFASPARIFFSPPQKCFRAHNDGCGGETDRSLKGMLVFKYIFGLLFKTGGWKNFQQTSGLGNPFVSPDTVLPADIVPWKESVAMWYAPIKHAVKQACLWQAIRPRWSGWWVTTLSASHPSHAAQCGAGLDEASEKNFLKSSSEPSVSTSSPPSPVTALWLLIPWSFCLA